MLALLYDIHGNLPALEAVLDDARGAGVDRFLLGGDYALFGAWPEETLDRLEDLAYAQWIRGNGERWTAAPAEAPGDDLIQAAIETCAAELGPERVHELARLPEQGVGLGTRFCHGSPVSDVRSFLPQPADDEAELLTGVEERRLVFGHTHLPFVRTSSASETDIQLVNPGSVGMPFDRDPRAAYALLDPTADRVEHRRVEYDHSAAAATVRERLGDWAETVARRIELARADVE